MITLQKTRKRGGGGVKYSPVTRAMRASGFFLCSEIAQVLQVHMSTVYRWMKQSQVEYREVNGIHYVKWNSVLDFMGPEVVAILNLKRFEEGGIRILVNPPQAVETAPEPVPMFALPLPVVAPLTAGPYPSSGAAPLMVGPLPGTGGYPMTVAATDPPFYYEEEQQSNMQFESIANPTLKLK